MPASPARAAPIDFRSDVFVRPSVAILAAMQVAAQMPGAFGLREDPRQRALEARVAGLLGTQDALLMPTATMANQVGIALHTHPGDIVLAPQGAHAATSEAGAPAALSGVRIVELSEPGPAPPDSAWAAHLTPADEQRSAVSLLILENTHNRAGGVPIPPDYGHALATLAQTHRIHLHLDGARLLHAALAFGVAPAALAAGFDTIAISLNKGLGGLIGAALAGSRTAIARAVMLRQRMGGGLRGIGPLAAGTLAALDDWPRLADDHRRVQRLAEGLLGIAGVGVLPDAPRTNILVLRCEMPAGEICGRLAAFGVLAIPFGPDRVRLVVHRDIDDEAIDHAIGAIRSALARGPESS
jgi:threonine aldolase